MPLKASPIYDIHQSFEENATYGPFWSAPLPTISQPQTQTTFLGQKMNSLFGVSACPLTVNSRYIQLLGKLGFDLITYKTVRSVEWRGNVFPHWVQVSVPPNSDLRGQVPPLVASLEVATAKPLPGQEVTMANSFGIHSVKPEYWQTDVDLTISQLQSGQSLILSLMCTPQPNEKLVVDAKRLARLASETKAPIFELNLACPNTDGGQGLIYEDLELSTELCRAVKEVIGDKPLLMKVGYYHDQTQVEKILVATQGVIAGVASINTVSQPIIDQQGTNFFPNRPTAGVSGSAIRSLALKQAAVFVKTKQKLGLDRLAVIGIGGVTEVEHIRQYLAVGVDAVQAAVGVWNDPYLAQKYKESL